MFDYDLADRVDDLICIFDNGNPDSDMDTISILLTGWITFIFASVFLLKFIYRKFKGKVSNPEGSQVGFNSEGTHIQSKSEGTHIQSNSGGSQIQSSSEGSRIQSNSEGTQKKAPASQKLTSTLPVPANGTTEKQTLAPQLSKQESLPLKQSDRIAPPAPAPPASPRSAPFTPPLHCSGPSPLVNEFVTASHTWLYVDKERKDKISEHVNSLFLKSMNKILHGIPHEDTFVASVDVLSLSNDLLLQNLFAEYEGTPDTIKITCDCEAKFTGQLSLSPSATGQDAQYEFIVNRFIGRLKFLIFIEQKVLNFKFDGWPEICLSIATTSRKNRVDPKFSEIITSKLSSALRNATLEIHLDDLPNFPALPIVPKILKKEKQQFLRVQLNGGVDIGLHKNCDTAYCVIELDDPAQKFQSRPKNLPNPIWNESYVLNTGTDGDAELLFEVCSAVDGTFLGCHIVSVDDIVNGKKEMLRLKSRRVKVAENISGMLEVVFTYVDEHEVRNDYQEITKIVVKPERIQRRADGAVSSLSGNLDWEPPNPEITPPTRPPRHSTVKLEDQYGEERGRRRTRRGDVFTSIHRRFSKERSKSVVANDGPASIDLEHNSARSVSVDRSERLGTGFGSDSTRSSASELSQHSSHSTATFMHESSTLLIECIENGVKKYYLIPAEEVGTGRWKNKKKLHIFNDHTFVAKRIQSGLSCTVCFGRFPFSLRKQGYQCRDCRLISHKECHIRIPTFCVKSTIYDIDVKGLKKEKAEKVGQTFLKSFLIPKNLENFTEDVI